MNSESLAWNRSLIGQPGGAVRLDTPALVLDLDAFEHNIATMAGLAKERGIGLRPHTKTHKCVTIAKAQVAAGAVGLCCAKLGEAEVLADGGLDHLLLTANVIGESKVMRLTNLNARLDDLMVVVDEQNNAFEIATAAAAAGKRQKVLIVNDVGAHRFGVPTVQDAVDLADAIASMPSLELMGIQGYAGPIQHLLDYAGREAATRLANDHLARVRKALLAKGHRCDIVTGSGTGTHDIDSRLGVFTDLQVGSYIFMDGGYAACGLEPGGGQRFPHSLFVATRVMSNRHAGFVTTDAGSKCFAMDGPPPALAAGAPEGSSYSMFGDQFGKVTLPAGSNGMPLNTQMRVIVPHCDPTVNLWDWLVCLRGDTVEAIWPIEARGAVA